MVSGVTIDISNCPPPVAGAYRTFQQEPLISLKGLPFLFLPFKYPRTGYAQNVFFSFKTALLYPLHLFGGILLIEQTLTPAQHPSVREQPLF